MTRVLRFLPVLAAIGCSAPAPTPHVLVSGSYPLAARDVRAIEKLVATRRDIAKPLQSIYADRPGHARISSGTPTRRIGSGNLFTVAKRDGKWMVDSRIEEEHLIYP